MLWLLYCILLMLLFKVRQRRGVYCCGGYFVYHYYLGFDREVIHVVIVILYFVNV